MTSQVALVAKNPPAGGTVLRWWSNRMGRSLSPQKIHWKII